VSFARPIVPPKTQRDGVCNFAEQVATAYEGGLRDGAARERERILAMIAEVLARRGGVVNRSSAIALLVVLAGCAAAAHPERVSQAAWLEARGHAERLSGGELTRGPGQAVAIWHLPIEDIRRLTGRDARAAAFRPGDVYFDEARPWTSDRGHHFGIVIHEAVHSMQPREMPGGCRELQAHRIQAAWLIEQGEHERGKEAARNARRHECLRSTGSSSGGWLPPPRNRAIIDP